MSIKKSIRIMLILASMIPVVLVTLIAHKLLTEKMIEENTQVLENTAMANISGLSAMINTQKTEVSLLSIQEDIYNAASQSNNASIHSTTSVYTLLKERCSASKDCERISLYNADKKLITSSDAKYTGLADEYKLTFDYIFETKSVAVGIAGLKALIIDGKITHTIEIASPILNKETGDIVGYIVSTVSTSYFNDILTSIAVGKTGFGILIDKTGTIIYHPNPTVIGANINSENLSQIATNYQSGSIEKSGKFELDLNHSKQVYGYCILPELNWVLLVKQDLSEIELATAIILPLLSIVCVITLIVTFIISSIIAKKYSGPIIALRDAMRKASDGNLTVQSNIKSNNEFGELSKNFNKMLHIIRKNYEDLESMHEELRSNEEQLRSNYDHIEFLAYHDTLTNLPNKMAFLEYVNAVLLSSAMNSSLHAVYFIDLDNFKTVNDTLGHEYGDALLLKTAQLLNSILGKNGMLARAGGDEFLLFIENTPTKDTSIDFANQIIDLFKNPIDLDGEIIYVSMSIGISIYPENGLTSNVLIKSADIAMYKSKDTGKKRFTLFDSKMEEELSRNTVIIEVLRNAIDNNEIYIQYQPQYEITTNNIIGFEALMRIRNERLGNLSPNEFIPIAEECGLIVELSNWLIREACTFNKNLIDLGAIPRPVSVNISSVQINRPGFITLLSDILYETQLSPQYLELEITESTLVSSIMDATKLLSSLQELGVRVSLDDFGTGYSSLNYLTKMPINTLKIDKSFIDNICYSRKDSFIAESIIQLAHSLDIRVIAEGVEHEEQLSLLRTNRCDFIQGYIYSSPLHPNALMDILCEDDLIKQYNLF